MACPACVLCKNEYCKLIRPEGDRDREYRDEGRTDRERERERYIYRWGHGNEMR